MTDNPAELSGLKLLSFDGGISGLSSLLIVREAMGHLRERILSDKPPEPWEYFDMIAGSGTGAISAVMLGRLRMSVDDAITTYSKIMRAILSDSSSIPGISNTSQAAALEEEIKMMVERATGNEGEKMLEKHPENVKCKVVVYAMSRHTMYASLPREFRSYSARTDALTNCTIWEAIRACTTHPSRFSEFRTGSPEEQVEFIHGEMGCSNPTGWMIEETKSAFPNRSIAFVFSIGAGQAKSIKIPKAARIGRIFSLGEATKARAIQAGYKVALDPERVAEQLARQLADLGTGYYRLNVDQGFQDIDSKEWRYLDQVAAHTHAYLKRFEIVERLNKAAVAIQTTPETFRKASSSKGSDRTGIIACRPPSARFTIRTEPMTRLQLYFSRKTTKQRVFVIYGLGGSGKTQLALKFVELMEERFSDVLFVDASSCESIETAMSCFATARHIGKTHQDTLRWLGTRDDCLLIFDNADDPKVGLRDYFPLGFEYDIIITTRHSGLVNLTQNSHGSYDTSKMELNEAKGLLLKLAGLDCEELLDAEKDAVIMLLDDKPFWEQELGCLALAVTQAGSFLMAAKQSVSSYYKIYSQRRKEILETGVGMFLQLDGYKRTVYTTWDLSFQQLSACAQQLLLLIAFLHRDGILEDIFRRAAANASAYKFVLPPSAQEREALDMVKEYLNLFEDNSGSWNSVSFLSCCAELISLSLISFDKATYAYSVHPLVQDWARAIAPDRKQALECTSLLLALSVGLGGTNQFGQMLVFHVNAILSHSLELDQTPNINHAPRFARVYWETGQFQSLCKLQELIVDVQGKILGRENPDTLTSIASLAWTHHELGNMQEAEKLEQSVIASRKQLLGENHPDTLAVMSELACTYNRQGRFVEAELLGRHILATQKTALGDDHPDTLESMSNLAWTYHELGRLEDAKNLGLSTVEARKRILGDHHDDTLVSMSNLAWVYTRLGKLEAAEALGTSVVAAYKNSLGGEHPKTLESMAGLAWTYYERGRLGEGEALNLSVLANRKRLLGDEHPHTLETASDLAVIYCKQGRAQEAGELGQKVLATRERILEDEHPDTLISRANLGWFYLMLGRLAEAEALVTSALSVQRRTLGEDHPQTLDSACSLVSIYNNQGRLDDAEHLGLRTLAAHKKILGADHPETMNSMDNLAFTYFRQGRLVEAEALGSDVLNARKRILGKEHPDTVSSMRDLAATYRKQGRGGLYKSLISEVKRIEAGRV